MTRDDIEHLVQVTHSLHGHIEKDDGSERPFQDDDFDRFIERMLWAIHASHDNPQFDERRFRDACRGEGGLRVFEE